MHGALRKGALQRGVEQNRGWMLRLQGFDSNGRHRLIYQKILAQHLRGVPRIEDFHPRVVGRIGHAEQFGVAQRRCRGRDGRGTTAEQK